MRRNKLYLVLLVAVMVMALTACGSNDTGDTTYKDGTYYGEGEHREHGYEAAEVTIEDGKIVNIVLKRMTAEGEEVNYDEWTGENNRPNLKQIREDLAQEMIDKQTYEVDAIATATQSCEGWKEAVKNALEDAK
ncbi:MAG TPA: FMN-binding protein [Tissierellia bacterium]|nr:FMN-binding protein [Tissierellia bacterium]